jgi:MoxR-like ATPase
VDGTTHRLPDPFFLVATQNPFEHAGTFPLVEGQRDRFAIVIEMGLPGRSTERELLLGTGGVDELERIVPVGDPARIHAAVEVVRRVHCSEAIADYIVDLAAATRTHADVRMGASPRASLAMLHLAQASAVLAGRDFVSPDDVKSIAVAALAHRLILTGGPDLAAAGAIVKASLERVPVPRG